MGQRRSKVGVDLPRTKSIEYMVHVVVKFARAQGVLYQLQDVSRLADEPAHQLELGVVLVGQHELTMLSDKGIRFP